MIVWDLKIIFLCLWLVELAYHPVQGQDTIGDFYFSFKFPGSNLELQNERSVNAPLGIQPADLNDLDSGPPLITVNLLPNQTTDPSLQFFSFIKFESWDTILSVDTGKTGHEYVFDCLWIQTNLTISNDSSTTTLTNTTLPIIPYRAPKRFDTQYHAVLVLLLQQTTALMDYLGPYDPNVDHASQNYCWNVNQLFMYQDGHSHPDKPIDFEISPSEIFFYAKNLTLNHSISTTTVTYSHFEFGSSITSLGTITTELMPIETETSTSTTSVTPTTSGSYSTVTTGSGSQSTGSTTTTTSNSGAHTIGMAHIHGLPRLIFCSTIVCLVYIFC